MTENILFFIFLIPAVLGVAEILHAVKLAVLSGKKHSSGVLVIVPDSELFYEQLMSAAEIFKWHGKRYAERIIVLDVLENGKSRDECILLAEKLGIEVCKTLDLPKKFKI